MDHHIKEYYCESSNDAPRGNFHHVISLVEDLSIEWSYVSKLVPGFCRGWYELSRLAEQDRIDFTRDFWLSKLPYHPKMFDFLISFFSAIDGIDIFITQKRSNDPYKGTLVYSLKDDTGFFRGSLPANETTIDDFQRKFSDFILPSDYLAFLQIHDGFCKTTDCTGIIPTNLMERSYAGFQETLSKEGTITTENGTVVNPKNLIPFYESFGMPFYQCFWSEWYPEQEMGNVYYSGITKKISDVAGSDPSAEGMAFPSFSDWLIFYMERIE